MIVPFPICYQIGNFHPDRDFTIRGLRSKTHVVLVSFKRAQSELANHQQLGLVKGWLKGARDRHGQVVKVCQFFKVKNARMAGDDVLKGLKGYSGPSLQQLDQRECQGGSRKVSSFPSGCIPKPSVNNPQVPL